MASITALSSASPAAVQFSCACGLGAPTSTTSSIAQVTGRVRPISTSSTTANKSLLSADRHMQSQFSLQALGMGVLHKKPTVTRSTRAELASDSDSGNVEDINDADKLLEIIAEAGDKLVVVDVSTKTCGPCRLVYPKVVKLSQEYEDALFVRIMGDFSAGTRGLMRSWGVRGVPNFRFFRNGKQVHSHTGAKEDDLRGHFLYHYHNAAKSVAAAAAAASK